MNARSPILLLALPLLVAAGGTEVASRDGANLQRPSWSPDATQLSYEANFHDRKEIELYVGDPQGPAFTRVQTSVRPTSLTAGFSSSRTAGKVVHELSWSPPSIGRFVYSASTDDADYDLFVAGGSAISPHPGADGGAAWSPDGRWIAFTSARTGEGDLYLVDVQHIESEPRRLTRDPHSSELYVDWSSDSTGLVWVGHSDRGDNLWLLPELDGTPRQLTDWAGSQIRPRWSPSGERVAFYANQRDESRFDLYVLDTSPGAIPLLLVEGVVPDAHGPAWTPSGSHIVFTLNDDEHFDPIGVVSSTDPRRMRALRLGTVGHGDLDVAADTSGTLWLAYVAQGRADDAQRDFRRLYTATIDELP